MSELDGKRAIVTGASSGIGAATAEALAAAGATVAVGARRKDRLDALVERIEGAGGNAHAFEVDVSEEDAARGFIDAAAEKMGGLDILVNNAGVMLLGPVAGADTEDWRRMVNVNILGLLYCTHAALVHMGTGGGGHIVNISSVAGRNSFLGGAVYNFTKFGVHGFSEALRQEGSFAKVRVTVIAPGFVETELHGHNKNPIVVEAIEKNREQLGETLQPEDVANSILYAVTQPAHAGINEILLRPSSQQR